MTIILNAYNKNHELIKIEVDPMIRPRVFLDGERITVLPERLSVSNEYGEMLDGFFDGWNNFEDGIEYDEHDYDLHKIRFERDAVEVTDAEVI